MLLVKKTVSATTLGVALLLAREAAARENDIRVLASNGVRAVLEELRPECEQAIGRTLTIEFNTSAALMREDRSG